MVRPSERRDATELGKYWASNIEGGAVTTSGNPVSSLIPLNQPSLSSHPISQTIHPRPVWSSFGRAGRLLYLAK